MGKKQRNIHFMPVLICCIPVTLQICALLTPFRERPTFGGWLSSQVPICCCSFSTCSMQMKWQFQFQFIISTVRVYDFFFLSVDSDKDVKIIFDVKIFSCSHVKNSIFKVLNCAKNSQLL